VSRRGKKIAEILSAEYEHNRAGAIRREVLQRKIKKTDPAKESGEIRDKSEETMDATSPALLRFANLTGVDHLRAARHKLPLKVSFGP
jgi:hypothetical protein